MTTFEPTPWEERLAERAAAFDAKKAKEKAERAQRKRGRNWGLKRRHAEKLARIAADSVVPQRNPGDDMPDVPPCCQGLDEPCPQHRQAAQVVQHQGPRRRHAGGGHRVVGAEGRAKPASPEETRG